ncbi:MULTISPECIES: DUF6318 family protein [Actinomyces]|uniref:DUF6318 family protein n=1 Tax=Actinomyces TaxID=1654 RepID=UPI001178BE12|nr:MULTISPECIES: DUF6318 family protein [Actinomyces]
MAPTPPRAPSHCLGTTAPQQHHRADARPPGRWRQGIVALGGRWAHPVALVLAACCALSPTLLTACAKETPPSEASGTLPTQFMATAPASTTGTPTASAPAALSPELAAQRATALAEPKPAKPEAASQNTEEGAVNAAAYFLQLYRYAFITGDTTDLAAMSEEGCVFCQSTIDDATKLHQDGGWANPWEISLTNISYAPPGEGKQYSRIEGTMIASASTSIDSKGEVIDNSEENINIVIAARYYDGSWHIRGVAVEK